jgi:single-strand DNA-binding protein
VSRTLNKVMLIGFVGRAPELRYTPAGQAVATFTLVVPREWEAPDGELRSATEWFNIVAWRALAERSHAALAADAHVFVEGALQTRTWQDAEGQRHSRTEIVADQVIVLDAAADGQAPPAARDAAPQPE